MTLLGHIPPGVSRMLALPRRYMRGRGFGVHSPFAYSFITDVLRPDTRRYAYYAYETIDAMDLPRRMRRMMRLWLRLAVALRPGEATVCAASPLHARCLAEAAALAIPGVRVAGPSDAAGCCRRLLWVDTHCAEALSPEDIAALINDSRGHCAVVTGPRHQALVARIEPLLTAGMIFAGGSATVIASEPDVPHQHFDIVI